ncbi:Ribonucleotide reductase alpha subunit [Pseudomonas syringae pv. actinidiae]|uniref:Ribonucleotide reductase alpha subunit n=1 Tax=Pseudomonas syringae pv. actinidiae TaxID=103796 RepID=A0AAN4TMY5_PSESF|nr:Ribonucleotide reductase alpha subunit [Pseudomonas syringae pv. actinidiae]
MFGDLPPSSCVTRLTVGAAACATKAPARFEPVIEIMSISGCAAIAPPTSGPLPLTRLNTPGGRPASCTSCVNSKALNGDSSLGLSTTVQPAAMAGATLAVI